MNKKIEKNKWSKRRRNVLNFYQKKGSDNASKHKQKSDNKQYASQLIGGRFNGLRADIQ